VENGPSVDRLAQINRGVNYGWNDTDASMTINAIYNWTTAHAPVNLAFIQPETFQGSQFPAGKMDHLFVSESGSTYAAGPQTTGKQVVEFVLDAAGNRLSGPTNLVQYSGTGRGSVVGLAAGPDGLYFTELYEDSGANGPTAPGARIFRVRYVNPLAGDYNIDGIVSEADYGVWKSNYGSNLFLAADGNHDGAVNAADYTIWRNNLGASAPAAAAGSASSASADVAPTSIQDLALADWTPVDSSLTVTRIVEHFPDRRVGVQHVDQQAALLSILDSLPPLRTRRIAASHDADTPPPTHGLPSNGAMHAQRHQKADEVSTLGSCLAPGIKLAFPANLP
jgi:hypothetical protein